MLRNRYVATAKAATMMVLGRRVRPGQDLWLTEGEARTPLGLGLVSAPNPAQEPASAPAGHQDTAQAAEPAQAPVLADPAPVDPLDHDGDGKKGGSLPGRRRKGRG